jgi:uncharacterized membrane protein
MMFEGLLSRLPAELAVILAAVLPVIELRGAIPLGISLGLSPIYSAGLGFIGSMLPVPIILFTIRPVFNYLKKTKTFRRIVEKITDRSLNVNAPKIQKYGARGLLIFVAIPLPGTGVWSGSLVAALLDMRFKWTFLSILIGNAIAGFIILMLSNGILQVVK